MSQLPDETDKSYNARKLLVDQQLESLAKAANDLEQLTLGWALDTSAKTSHVDLVIAAVDGTPLAKQLSQVKNSRSDFAGFMSPDAAASFNVAATMNKENTGQFVTGLQTFRTQARQRIDAEERLSGDDASKKLAKEMVGEIFDAIQATLESGKIDAGATLKLTEKSMALAVGAHVANPKALEDALKKFNQLVENEPKFPGIKFDAATHNGVRFHTTQIPVPQDDEISKVLGSRLDVALGIGSDSVYLALGSESLTLVKQLIDKSKTMTSKEVPPLQVNVLLAPIFQFAAAMQKDNPDVKATAEALSKSQGKDQVHVAVMPQANGLMIRIDAQEAVIAMVARSLAASGAAAVQGGLP